jgi:hypothetical protein
LGRQYYRFFACRTGSRYSGAATHQDVEDEIGPRSRGRFPDDEMAREHADGEGGRHEAGSGRDPDEVAHPQPQRPGLAAIFMAMRWIFRPLRAMVSALIEDHPHRPLQYLEGMPRRCSHRFILSKAEASTKPGRSTRA